MDDFSAHPKTISEIKSDKSENAGDWTPRDALIHLLREIDKGEASPTELVMVYRDKTDEESKGIGWLVASGDGHVTLGMLEQCKFAIMFKGALEG